MEDVQNNKLRHDGHSSAVIGFIEGHVFTNLIRGTVVQQFGGHGSGHKTNNDDAGITVESEATTWLPFNY